MQLRVLGCSGGLGGRQQQTTALLVDRDILIDAGTGVGDLGIDEMAAIDHVFLTHAHVDHIAALPLLIDSVGERRQQPLTIHALPAVIDCLRQHIFNWAIWPDFSVVPHTAAPYMTFCPLSVGETVSLDGRSMTALPVEHTVPAVGYHIASDQGSLVFSGDTGPCDAFWQVVNDIDKLRHLIIECAFPDRQRPLAELSKHLCPAMLREELAKFRQGGCAIHVTHLKPGDVTTTMHEIETQLAAYAPKMLQPGQVIVL